MIRAYWRDYLFPDPSRFQRRRRIDFWDDCTGPNRVLWVHQNASAQAASRSATGQGSMPLSEECRWCIKS